MTAIDVLRHEASVAAGSDDPLASVLAAVRKAGVVLIGEASHGTHEFYRERAEPTKRLVTEHGAVAARGGLARRVAE